jgi:hypothetical protein
MKSILSVLCLLAVLAPSVVSAQSDSATVTLATQNASGISGTATLTQVGSDLKVDITVTGMAASGAHPAHIHAGHCPNPGAVVHSLTTVENGTSTTTLTGVTLASVSDGDHSINLHDSSTNMSLYIACGDIAMMASTEPTAAATTAPVAAATTAAPGLPATGGGPGGEIPWAWIAAAIAVAVGLGATRASRQAVKSE